ncbi:hypothetical protein QFC24_006655 [Naganishia onofrii]|uniref:Uncharacterized protein n=1 Tax=Naganishia onofrii TaxID=1851511 RepID=A0ACC2X022_9TREE|nr:hypothetical protein QFC24_006655 [Naganishia onofrii]
MTVKQNDTTSTVDVLIIGAGPAGLMAANWLSRFPDITTRIIDKRNGNLENGQADGLNSRTLEIFESIGIYEMISKEASRMSEIAFWNPCPDTGRLTRTGCIPDTIPGLSRFQQAILHQNRIEKHLMDNTLLNSNGKLVVERGVSPETLKIDESLVDSQAAYPITLELKHLSDAESMPDESVTKVAGIKSGIFRSSLMSAEQEEALYKRDDDSRMEVVKAKMEGEQTNYVWGVLDMIPLTNFPDIRKRCAIHSAKSGSVMVIPQERNLVRLYIQLPQRVKQGEYLDRSKITADSILKTAQAVFFPYTLEASRIEWFTGYHIGQRLTSSFGKHRRVFLAGDACHTHSPKAGQGMNTSMQDTFNLGWKLAYVLRGVAKPELLDTYTGERQVVAKTLIEFDTKFSKLFSGKPRGRDGIEEEDTISLEEFHKVFATGNDSGMSIDYGDSQLVHKSKSTKQALAIKLPIGKRFFSAQVVNMASATSDQLATRIPTTGAFRLLVFPGNVAEPDLMLRLKTLAAYLDRPDTFLSKYTPRSSKGRDEIIDIVTIREYHSSPRGNLQLYDFPQPSIFLPHNYQKIFVDDESYHMGHGHAYDAYGIDKAVGAVVVVRPDQHVSLIVGLEDTDLLEDYFGGFMREAQDGGFPAELIPKMQPPAWETAPSEPDNNASVLRAQDIAVEKLVIA